MVDVRSYPPSSVYVLIIYRITLPVEESVTMNSKTENSPCVIRKKYIHIYIYHC